jgi:aspartyl/glutamyl-tRNA(Asn/Gln) amidotransferase C subunit
MISKEEVEHIAKLARLELTESEVEKMQKDLSEILGYFDLLKRVARPSAAIPAAEGGLGTLRKDEVISSHDIAGELIAAAPDKKDDYIKVKAIF